MMKNGTVQLCLLVVAITGMHTAKIMRSSAAKLQGLHVKNTRNTLLFTKVDSLNANAGNRVLNVAYHPAMFDFVKTVQ
jgi:hypothetical protein